eukprot:XP_011670048.1 PREDICTED: uncharacterized protein LOC100890728 [Strongylocentrotus purpuratus]
MNSASSRSKVKKPCRNKKPSHNANPSYHSGFFCHCSSCRSFHRLFVKDIDVVSKVCATARNKSSLQLSNEAFLDRFKETQLNAKPKWIKLGDRVTARGTHTGIVKYIGPLDDRVISPPTYVGIQLDEPVGLHCGIVNGKRYFETPKGRGLMVKYEEVSKRKPAEKCPPIQGNTMFPSYEPGKYTRLWADRKPTQHHRGVPALRWETPVPGDVKTPVSGQHRPAGADGATPLGTPPPWSLGRPMATPLQIAGMDPMPEHTQQPWNYNPRCVTSHQIKTVGTFSGRGGVKVEDWVRDMRYVIDSKGPMPLRAEFNEIVRHTGGRARDLLLNLELGEPSSCTPEAAFGELLEEYGEREWTASPMAAFYARMQHPNESPSDYAIALEAKLRMAKEKGAGSAKVEAKARDEMLTIQFMYGLRDQDVKSRLAPMRPRDMSFRELRRELKVIDEEQKQRKGANSYRMDNKHLVFYTKSSMINNGQEQD